MLPEEVCKQEISAEETSLLQNSITVERYPEQNMPPAEYYVPVTTETNGIPLYNNYVNSIKVEPSLLTPEISSSTFFGSWTTKLVIPNKQPEILDISTFLNLSLQTISKILHESIHIHERIAFQLSIYVNCTCPCDTECLIKQEAPFVQQNKSLSSQEVILNSNSDIEDTIDIIASLLAIDNAEELTQCAIDEIFHLEISTRQLPKRRGSHLNIPTDIRISGAVVNMKNLDNFCFKWAVIAAISNKTCFNLQRISIYEIKDITQEKIHTSGMTLDFSGLDFPVNYWDLRIFEKRNKKISLNVFGLEVLDDNRSKIVGPLYRTKKGSPCQIHINLLYFTNEESGVCHYMYIKNMSRFLRKQVLKRRMHVFFCNKCLWPFICKDSLARHKCEMLKVYL